MYKLIQKILTIAALVTSFAFIGRTNQVNAADSYFPLIVANIQEVNGQKVGVNYETSSNVLNNVSMDVYYYGSFPNAKLKVYLVADANPTHEVINTYDPKTARYFDKVSEDKLLNLTADQGTIKLTFDKVKLPYSTTNVRCFYEVVNDFTTPNGSNRTYCGGDPNTNGVPDNFFYVNYTGDDVALFRFWSEENQSHFFTANKSERYIVDKDYNNTTWNYEGINYYVKKTVNGKCNSGSPVHRFWSQDNLSHFYTINSAEKDFIIANNPTNVWNYEGISFCANTKPASGLRPVYRFYSELNKAHFYTVNEAEKNHIISTYPQDVWRYEDIAYYAGA